MRPADRLDAGLGYAQMAHLALRNQILNRSGNSFDRHVGVDAMLMEEINGVGAQSASATSRMRSGRLSRPLVGTPYFKAEVGGEDDLRAKGSDRFP